MTDVSKYIDMVAELGKQRDTLRGLLREVREGKITVIFDRSDLAKRIDAALAITPDQPAAVHEFTEGAVSVMNPQGTEETGSDRPAAPDSQPAAVRVCDTCGNPVEVMPFKTHAPHHEPMQHVLCDVCKTAITERRRADQPSAAHLSNIVDKPADQPAAVRDPEAVEIVRCPRCHALPRPSLMGGCVCPNCGTTVLQPVPESAADKPDVTHGGSHEADQD